ncbi:MAG: amidohydrolase family protein, partial [Halobacteria archaeon]|nr:amidohydrolase family protein [Halobacteria archaeon]
MNEIQRVTLGEKPADIVLTGGRVLLPELNDFVERDVAIKDDRVASLPRPESSSDLIGEETRVIDTEGKTVVPGFIDPHTHIDHQLAFETYYHHALKGGTTTVITEADAFGLSLGSEGVEGLLDATSDLDINVLGTVPPQPFFDTFEPQEYYDKRAFVDLLKNDRIVGVGESDWIHVVGRDTPAEDLYEACHDLGKRVSGHGAGCSGVKLEAFASVIDNDHEAITGEQIVERVGNGIHAIGRGGSIRDDTRAVADAYKEIGPDELSLSSDGMWPTDMVEKGYMDFVVRRAIEEGIEPQDAVRMATLNPARHFKLDGLGSITPGKRADVVILESLESVDVDTVISAGKVVVEGGE